MTRVIPMLIIGIFLTTLIIVPSLFAFGGSDALANIDGPIESEALISQMPHNARVAIYDEDNTTTPVYSSAYYLTNNISEITSILEDAGHSVDALTEEDILNRELLTANYDVFIMVNNVPRPSIINHVKEFWMGGGSILSFNSAISYLCYAGILDPTSSDDEYISMWVYGETSVQNVTTRHPTMKAYHVNDSVTERTRDWVMTSTIVLDNIDLYSNPIGLLSDWDFTILVSGFALDQCDNGGRVVQLPGDGYSVPTDFESIIVDSVEWLVPRPKGRIVYDLTHQPRLCVDTWDFGLATVWSSDNNYGQFRTLAVNHSYTFDKLYPSASGNLTANRLADYDVLVICWPDLNYTGAEIAAVETWVENGGSLLVLGDRNGLVGPNPGDLAINELLQNFDMSLGTTDILDNADMTPGTHLTIEGCTSLRMGYRNHLVVLSNATSLWFDGSFPVVASEEFGAGRAILSADMNIFDNMYLSSNSNTRFALNVLNWLTSNDARILVHTDYLGWDSAVCIALRDLGFSYSLFTTRQYLDDFVDSQSWDLLIYNNVNYVPESLIYDELYAFVNTGGTLILTSFDVDSHPTHPLWSKMGVEWSSSLSGQPTMYLWDASHAIFTEPNDHSMFNYTSGTIFADDGDVVTYSTGYTALGGTTATPQGDTAAIVVSNDRKTLFNTIIIDNFETDEDDSTYTDNVELWQNEIVFMMTEPPGGFPIDTTTLLLIGAGVLAVAVIGAVVYRARSGGGSSKPKKKPAKKKK
ncbi:MAG: DUF4350 domain-containing protein [Candidatus Thorarchaeota archaeon]